MSQCATLLHKFCQLKQGLDWHMVLLVVMLCTTCIPTALSPWLLYVFFGCSTYTCYVYTKEIPGLICTGLILPVSIVLSILHWGRINSTYLRILYMRLENIMELVFSNYLKNCKFNNREEKLFTTQGYEVNLKEMHWLTIILVQATLLATGQFLNDFLVEVSNSYSTDPNICCYYTTILVPSQEINCLNAS